MLSYEEIGGDALGVQIMGAMLADYVTAEHPPDAGMGAWNLRTCFDAISIGGPASIAKHRQEWRDGLNQWRVEHGLPPVTWPNPGPSPALRVIRAGFCSHRDLQGDVVFDPIYFGVHWDRGDVVLIDQTLAVKVSLSISHVLVAVQGGYGGYMGGATFDWRGTPSRLADLASHIISRGLFPIVYVCTADGGTEVEIYDGTMQRVVDAVAPLADSCWYSPGYEVNKDRGGAFTAKQTSDALLLMRRRLGPSTLIGLHLQPNRCTPASYYPSPGPGLVPNGGGYMEADDPFHGDEQGAFYTAGGLEVDAILYQTPHGSDGPSYISGGPGLDGHGQPRYIDRIIECADRFLPPGTPMPGARGHVNGDGVTHGDVAEGPDWFASTRPRGRVTFCVLETVPEEYVRGNCSDDAVRACTALVGSCGITTFGCLP